MTEKRFYLMNVEDPLHEYGRWCKPVLEDGETGKQYENALEVMDLLNALVDENEKLKQSYIQLKHRHSLLHDECLDAECDRDSYHNDVLSLEKENEQLKQFKEKVFVLLDEKIKHYEHKPFSAPIGQPMSVNFDVDVDRIARLSELQDLEKELKMND